ncbi:MAG: VWA domain-containing protein [Sulfurimonas sp.]|nr:VWA domain-containing protein [Sulfurimonas sp.]MDD5202455.1 VWA domain-containing protein [Sulfurimonas sp.]
MSFLHPEFLYFMLPPLFILFGFLLTQKEQQAHFFSDEVLQKLRVNANTLTLRARNGLFFLIGFLMIVALSAPVIKEGTVLVKAKSADIIIALDISDSMLAEDVYPSRLQVAKQKALELLEVAPNERVGVVAFAKNSYLVSPLSFDHNAVRFLLSQLDTASITQKGTDILSLLEVVAESIQSTGKKYLLILSDGSDASDFSKEIAFAKEKNIVIFVLGIGTQKGAPIKLSDGTFIKYNGEIIVSKLNQEIAALATQSGGVYIENVKSQEDIKTMLSEIERHSEQKELKSEEIARFIPLFYYPLGLALLLLLFATSSMSKRVKVNLPSAFIFAAFLVYQPNAEAAIFDFVALNKAKSAYEEADYERAAKIYEEYAKRTNDAQSYFNAANALYKAQKYEDALKNYEKADVKSKQEKANKYANIGNTHAKIGGKEQLQEALVAYEKSLEFEEDKAVRENHELVKKALQEQEEQDKENQKDEDKQQQNDQKENKEEQDKQEQNKEEKQEEKQDKQEQNKDENQKSEQEDKQNKNKETSKNNEGTKSEQEKKDDNSKENEENQKDDKEQKAKNIKEKESLKELQKEDKKEQNTSEETQNAAPDKMSDAEEEKWIRELNLNQNSYMYKLNNTNKNEEKTDEKPW